MTDFECNFNCEERKPIEAEFTINAKTAVATWGSITGLLSNQTDLQNALNSKANISTTINGHALNNNITLSTSDLNNDSGYITLENISSNATGLSYDNNTGVISLEEGYEIPLSETLENYVTKDVDNLTYYRKSTTQDIIDNELSTRITDEVTARTNADNQLSSRISTETTNRHNADVILQQNIDTETLARSNADTLLSNRISSNQQAIGTETQSRISADTTLQNNIDAEIADREVSESNLSDRIDINEENISAEVIARTNAINTVNQAISQEVLDRTSGDSALQEEINDLSSNLTSHTNNTNNPHYVTKSQIGLSNVDNTSDIDKPISTAVQNALNQKATISSVQNLSDKVEDIENVVPTEATTSNKLADKNYVDISIGKGDLTIQKNNTNIGVFNANSSVNKSINIDVPTKTSELTNDSNFIDLTDISSESESLTYDNSNGAISVTPGYSITTSIERNQIQVNADDILDIQEVIPDQASAQNQLADKDFVNSTIQTGTANFRGNWATWADVPIYPNEYPEDYSGVRTPNTNDYMVVENTSDYAPLYSNQRPYPIDFCVYYNNILYKSLEEISIPEDFNPSKWEQVTDGSYLGTWRFKYVGSWNTVAREGWKPEYRVNEEPFTINQWKAIDSGITSDDMPLIHNAIQPNDNISELTNNVGYITKDVNNLTNYTTTTNLNTLLNQKQNTITGGATTITSNNLTASRALISDSNGKVGVSNITSTELEYLDNVTSNIQNQLDNKSDINLSNLSSDGNNRLHALKGYSDEGELLTDAEGLADVTSYAHSTFDLSKFTVVGSPNITYDGIASGISVNSSSNIDLSSSPTKWTIVSPIYKITTASTSVLIPFSWGNASTGAINFSLRPNGVIGMNYNYTNGTGVVQTSGTDIVHINTAIQCKWEYDNGTLTMSYKIGNDNWVVLKTATVTPCASSGVIEFSRVATNGCTCDLKTGGVKVDGVPVFSGNQTGIDTIKPDNYTVVGTPTISADGVASGFSSSNYLQTNFTYNTFIANFSYTWNGTNPTASSFIYKIQTVDNHEAINVYQKTNGYLDIVTRVSNSSHYDFTNFAISADIPVLINISKTATSLTVNAFQNGINIFTKTVTTNIPTFDSSSILQIGNDVINGSIDLNSFKIYVDGNLVYQPCLKIPYTESKTGSKIVDSAYRDRVSDMYEQFGYAPYYTLDEGTSFTIPQGEIYGNIKETTVNEIENESLVASGYLNEGYEITNKKEIELVDKYAHSTFDRSKFTVLGSPNITDDGIASGFSSNNFITCNKPELWNYSNWSVVSPYFTPSALSSDEYIVNYMCTINGSDDGINLVLTSSGDFQVYCPSSTTGATISTTYVVGATVGNSYQFRCDFTGSQFKFYYRRKGSEWTLAGAVNRTVNIGTQTNDLTLGGRNTGGSSSASYVLIGSLDLKHCSVEVDGVPVFSGNQTGIDTIKPDNYTVVGTPTISADGVASGFSGSNYLTLPITANDIQLGTTIYMSFTTNNVATQQWLIDYTTLTGVALEIINSKLRIRYYKTSSSYDTPAGTNNLQNNTTYIVRLEYYKVDNTYKVDVYLSSDNGATWVNEIAHTSTSALYSASYAMTLGAASGTSAPNLGSIDLNSFKIYVDGNLVYQPCLKIPYTESKTGSKIIDSYYRSRVEDAYNQFGSANYFIQDDNYVIKPYGEIYGLIGQQTLRKSSVSGINRSFLYSDRTLLLTGSCTSGVEVTLPTPFVNSNYMLSIPYSAKSATAFTPTQTGDWFAIGEGVL